MWCGVVVDWIGLDGCYLCVWVDGEGDEGIVGLVGVADVDGHRGAPVSVRGVASISWRIGRVIALGAIAADFLKLLAIVVATHLDQ